MATNRRTKLACLVTSLIAIACIAMIKYANHISELSRLSISQFSLAIVGLLLVFVIVAGIAIFLGARLLEDYFEPKNVDD